ncbi:DUF72 domain-containing protein [Polaromonas aquatica]|uniref:DUF72 domain-containing protein n=1 Tax=Polaromonas aquatica TaxID=332657 RepID=UPI003D65FA6E
MKRSPIRIGISGWQYAGWRGVFYPPGLVQAHELAFASRAMQTIEINGSHYSLQRPGSYQRWHDDTPDDFVFSVKAPRYLTHILRLEGDAVPVALANFIASGVFNLRGKLGPLLWQFPPSMAFKPEVFESFLQLLPHDTEAAARFASQHHDSHVRHPCLETDRKRRMRHAIEIRHPSFCTDEFVRMLRRYRAALVVSEAVADWPYVEDVTGDFVYLRLHGPETLYGGRYSDTALDRWAARISAWASGGEPEDAHHISNLRPRVRSTRDVYCYFDNDQKVRAPFDARRLTERLMPKEALSLEPLDRHAGLSDS